MEEQNRRKILERYESSNCSVIVSEDLDSLPNQEERGELVNINRLGALVKGDFQKKNEVYITLIDTLNNEILIEKRKGKILKDKHERKDKEKQQVYRVFLFNDELTPKDFVRLNKCVEATPKNNPRLWKLMLSDRKEIKEEMYRIERCRSDIFLTVVTAIFASTVTIGCLIAKDSAYIKALYVVSILTFLMFILGAYTTIEKATRRNECQGMLGNLNRYILRGRMPVSYQGWATIKYYFRNCGVMRRLDICPRKVTYKESILRAIWNKIKRVSVPQTQSQSTSCCQVEARKTIRELNYAKRIMPGMSDSFMSLCSYAYSFLYLASFFTFAYLTISMLSTVFDRYFIAAEESFAFPHKFNIKLFLIMSAGVCSSFSFLVKYRKAVFYVSSLLLIVAWVASRFMKTDITTENYQIPAMIVVFIVGFIVGSIGAHLLKSLYSIRKGRRSPECFYYAWKIALKECFPVNACVEDGIVYKPRRLRDWIVHLYEKLFFEKT